jgi:hypothetical protein
MRDFAIDLNARSGELARVASVLARHQVTLRAGTAMVVGRRLVARFIPSDEAATRLALDVAGVRFEESEIVPVLLESRAGELAMLSTRLASGGVGVRAIYLTATVGRLIEVAVVPTNLARARLALE